MNWLPNDPLDPRIAEDDERELRERFDRIAEKGEFERGDEGLLRLRDVVNRLAALKGEHGHPAGHVRSSNDEIAENVAWLGREFEKYDLDIRDLTQVAWRMGAVVAENVMATLDREGGMTWERLSQLLTAACGETWLDALLTGTTFGSER